MKKTRLTIFFDLEFFERVHLYKDLGAIARYAAHYYECQSEIVFYEHPKNQTLTGKVLGVNLTRITKTDRNWHQRIIPRVITKMAIHILIHARKTDIAVFFHLRIINILYILIFKTINPRGKVFLKLDINRIGIAFLKQLQEDSTNLLASFNFFRQIFNPKQIKSVILLWAFRQSIRLTHIVSAETVEAFETTRRILSNRKNYSKFMHIPNGFDELVFSNERELITNEKEKLIISVASFGLPAKNSDMLLRVLSKLHMHDWRVCLIGSTTDEFSQKLKDFFKKNPDKIGTVKIIGNINDREVLYNYYRRAKVFILTSRSEGFPLVFTEAAYFGNFIISTRIGADSDITDSGRFGCSFEIDDDTSMASRVQDIIDGSFETEEISREFMEHSRRYSTWQQILSPVFDELGLIRRNLIS